MADLLAETPQPPEVPPRLRFRRIELSGIAVMALLPAAALAGVFGPTIVHERGQVGVLSIEAEYPTRLRSAMFERISVRLSNRSDSSVADLTVSFDPEFMHAFSQLAFSPEPEEPYVVRVPEIPPGETRLVEIEITAEEYGLHEGWISVDAPGASGSLPVRTLILP